jgi:type I restriction enzyme S subunit
MSTQSLKPGWKMVKFGEVVQNANLVKRDPEANGVERIVGLEHIDPENLHIRRWNSIADGTSFTRKFVLGQTLFGKRRAYQRKVAYAEFEGICSGDILTFEPKNKKVLLPKLLPFICQSDAFFDHALDTSAGSLSPRTNWTALKDFEFPLPPLDEQNRIAEILWAADEAVERYIATSTKLHQLRNAIWADIFRSTDVPWSTISAIARVGNGTTPSRKNNGFWVDGTIPWLSSGKIHERIIRSADEFITPSALKKAKHSFFPAGTVLVAMIGQGKTRGTAAFLAIDACINQNMAAIAPAEKSEGKYIFYCLDQMYDKLRNWSHGSNQGALNCALVERFQIPLPPAKMRAEVGEISDKIETEIVQVANHVQVLRETLKSISTHFISEARCQ